MKTIWNLSAEQLPLVLERTTSRKVFQHPTKEKLAVWTLFSVNGDSSVFSLWVKRTHCLHGLVDLTLKTLNMVALCPFIENSEYLKIISKMDLELFFFKQLFILHWFTAIQSAVWFHNQSCDLSLYFLAQRKDPKRRRYQCHARSKQPPTSERAHPDAGVSVSS